MPAAKSEYDPSPLPDSIDLPVAVALADVDDALIVTMARILGLCADQDGCGSSGGARPSPLPDSIQVPAAIVYANVDDALIVTMIRILGLCAGQDGRGSPPYTPDQLAGLLGRPRTTLYRHLAKLQELGWLRVDRRRRRLVLHPLIPGPEGPAPAGNLPEGAGGGEDLPEGAGDGEDGGHNRDLRQALQEAGIVGRPCRELLRQRPDPAVVRAWTLWTWAPEQAWLDNPAGYIVSRLRAGGQPPPEFLALARLTPRETALLADAWVGSEAYRGWPSLDGHEKLRQLAPLWAAIQAARRRCEL